MKAQMWAFCGRVVYRLLGPFVLPIVLHNTERVRIILVDESQKVLLSKTWIGDQAWDFVGGGIDSDEDMYVAAIRETEEETGLVLTQNELKFIESIESSEYFARYTNHIFVANVAHFTAEKPKLELLDLAWFSVHKLPKQQRSHVKSFVAKVTTIKT